MLLLATFTITFAVRRELQSDLVFGANQGSEDLYVGEIRFLKAKLAESMKNATKLKEELDTYKKVLMSVQESVNINITFNY